MRCFLSICWNKDITLRFTGVRPCLLCSTTNSILMLVSLQCEEVVQTWKETDLNTAMSQLLLHTYTLAGFKLGEFNKKIEMVEGIDGLRLSLRLGISWFRKPGIVLCLCILP